MREISEAWYKTTAVCVAAWGPTLLGRGEIPEKAGCI
jgi:hypothetical protein